MTYSTFPAVPMKCQLGKQVRSTATDQPLGDGYTYRTQFGLHPLEEMWQVRMLIKLDAAETVRSFLEARATDGLPFHWPPPDYTAGNVPLWKVEEWTIARKFQSRVEIDLQLRRVWGELPNLGGGIGVMGLGGVPHYTRGQPDLGSAAFVRWVGVQWSERAYSGSGGGSGPWGPVTVDVPTGWDPLRNNSGQLITYGIGGIEWSLAAQTGFAGLSYSAEHYLGPWYSNIDIFIPSYGPGFGIGGSMDVFYLYTASPTEPLRTNNTNYGFSFGRQAPDTSNFATSRGRWEFANSDGAGGYDVIFTWAGYSKLR